MDNVMNLRNWKGKLRRTLNILGDSSEIFDERPSYRFEVIKGIWKEK